MNRAAADASRSRYREEAARISRRPEPDDVHEFGRAARRRAKSRTPRALLGRRRRERTSPSLSDVASRVGICRRSVTSKCDRLPARFWMRRIGTLRPTSGLGLREASGRRDDVADLAECRPSPSRRQLAHAASTSLISSSSGVRSSPKTCARLAEPAVLRRTACSRSRRRVIASAAATWSRMRSSQASCSAVKIAAGVLLLEQPGVVALAHEVGVGDELVVLVEREADERDEVGEHALAGAAHLRAVELPRRPARASPASTGAAAARSPAASSLTSREGQPLRLYGGRRGSGAR